ncbi:carboxymuconolactone decarboxylase [Pseudomonas daroniae]|uniref:Carboxymuconolactone decarboxylase n=2 Tax=Phytopseudomonas TaxID=3236657 RepID=A0A4Q9R9F3_9GAMM|nr:MULTISPECIES: carboxymuconolactone decarboxylase [Pseudomonas]TBU73773.1 carboxymuconolactone decarboxylase [Pseudomonas daroniae]TBU79524.1 carboxymuconolactone decarboxylase [Pseudomonas sp. FRB 228]TBU88217.1 carboxymuconolactone decarboxylase [Pseudomonas daroniae]TBU96741.1 carboxymuconolactone decarboxylase [Pseudomonas dryadis]
MNGRLQPIEPENTSDKQKEVIARLGEGRGRIPTPFNIWLHNPHLAEGMEIIGTHIDRSPVLSEVESEVAILSTAVFWNAPYVIANHRRHALKAGVPEAMVRAILEKQRPEPGDGRLGVISDAVCDILAGGVIDDERFARYEADLGRAVIAELLIVVGYFTSVSLAMSLHALQPKG